MRLVRLDYSEFLGEPQEWRLVDCTFGDVNLIVGRNATGKTRTLNVISGLANLLSEMGELKWNEGKYTIDFENDGKLTSCVLEYHDRAVTSERLVIDSKEYLSRDSDGSGKIFAAQVGDDIQFQIPVNQVAAFAKRDSIQHPFLEDLYLWGKGLIKYDFGTPLGKDLVLLQGQQEGNDNYTDFDIRQTRRVVGIFLRGKKEYSTAFIQSIIVDMKSIGYELEDIGVENVPGVSIKSNIPAVFLGIYVQEADLQTRTVQGSMSQGMFRALSILIQVNYALLSGEPSCILIDDIGEGLDFSRSSKLVRLLVERVAGSSTQLIMATNDRFIMNNVPFEYWIILERQGGRCIHHNYRNAKQMFDEFELTGMNNFDLFSSNYYLGRNGQ